MYTLGLLGLTYTVGINNGTTLNILVVFGALGLLVLFTISNLALNKGKSMALADATKSKSSATTQTGFSDGVTDFVADCKEKDDLKADSLQSERFVETRHKTDSGGLTTIKDNKTGVEYLLYRSIHGGVTMIPLIKGMT